MLLDVMGRDSNIVPNPGPCPGGGGGSLFGFCLLTFVTDMNELVQ